MFPDPWLSLTPRNLQLAGAAGCDPYAPSFYLAMIDLRDGAYARARIRFDKIYNAPAIRSGEPGAVTRLVLRVNAATFAGVTAILQRRLGDAASALTRARRLDPQNASYLKNQGYLFERRGQLDEAIAAYREALVWDRDRYDDSRRWKRARASA